MLTVDVILPKYCTNTLGFVRGIHVLFTLLTNDTNVRVFFTYQQLLSMKFELRTSSNTVKIESSDRTVIKLISDQIYLNEQRHLMSCLL